MNSSDTITITADDYTLTNVLSYDCDDIIISDYFYDSNLTNQHNFEFNDDLFWIDPCKNYTATELREITGILEASKTNEALALALEKLRILYYLSKDDGDQNQET